MERFSNLHYFKHCICVDFLLIEGQVQGALRKELRIAPLVQHFQNVSSGKAY